MTYCTGLRLSELLALNAADVDLERRRVHVHGIKREDDRVIFFDETCQETERYLHVDPEGLQQVYDAAKAKLTLDLTYQTGR